MRYDFLTLFNMAVLPLMVSGMLIFDFSTADEAKDWRIINDGVMGGRSRSEFLISVDSMAVFTGVLSLENYGGFASVRSAPASYDLGGYDGIELRVLGDGRSYQIRLSTDSRYDGVAYRYDFDTSKGEWLTVRAPFSGFSPTYRGRTLTDYKPLDPAGIQQIGFLIADKIAGPFRLEIDSVSAYAADSP
jgi:monofunctional biosynthetic peptidoglycan transglycosylase